MLDKLTIQDIGAGSVQIASRFAHDSMTVVDFNDLTLSIQPRERENDHKSCLLLVLFIFALNLDLVISVCSVFAKLPIAIKTSSIPQTMTWKTKSKKTI